MQFDFGACEQVFVGGYPCVFVVTTKEVKKGEVLWVYYGDSYGEAIGNFEKCIGLVKERGKMVDGALNNLLKSLGVPLKLGVKKRKL